MGLPNDPQRDYVWVDTYGGEFSRDIEPTVEMGDTVYQVTKSCIQMYKSGQTCNENNSDDAAAAHPANLCCSTKDKNIWNNVWSLRRQHKRQRNAKDDNGEKNSRGVDANSSTGEILVHYNENVLTSSLALKENLLKSNSEWKELCTGTKGSSVFCYGDPDGREGPMMVYNTPTALPNNTAVPLYRCCRHTTSRAVATSLIQKETNDNYTNHKNNTDGIASVTAERRRVNMLRSTENQHDSQRESLSHFLSVSPTCEEEENYNSSMGLNDKGNRQSSPCPRRTHEELIGWMSPTRGGETLRELRRCRYIDSKTGLVTYSHALDLPCYASSSSSSFSSRSDSKGNNRMDDDASVHLGYVR